MLFRPPLAASQHPTAAIAERNQPVGVLGYQGLVQCASCVEPLIVGVDARRMSDHSAETAMCRCPAWRCRSSERSYHYYSDTIVTTSSRYCCRDATAYNNLATTANQGLAATKMNPEQRMLSGFLQVVASACRLLYPGGRGVGGWGAARIGPTKQKLRYEISPPKYRSGVLTFVKARSILTGG